MSRRRLAVARHRLRDGTDWLCRALWLRMPVFLACGTVYGVYLVFAAHDIEPASTIDTRIVVAMGVAYLMAALVMFGQNERWPLKAIGQFVTYLADAQLWLGVGAGRLRWRHDIDTRDLQILRAWFVVGTAALILGIVVYEGRRLRAWQRRRRERRGQDE